ncbi:MAG TPA: dihydroorotate dehydrogenase-like protein [Vicinamibacterales bacterium]|nr:dihydroorotate dehydrogenase-like protein [Vicinamibacterales bacterium]
MDLRTRYLGLDLPHPFMPGASPLVDSIDAVLRLEDAGAAAIVLSSLFEEDVVHRGVGPERYLEHLLRVKQRTHLPVIASLNGTTAEGWLQYARLLERAGADALELNFYFVATDLFEDALAVERRIIDISAVLKESIGIPIAVKLSPFFTALPHLARRLDQIGADGLVLFNRFYQPDINPETLEIPLDLELSTPAELLLRLRWIAILHGRVRPSLALSGGVHTGRDAVKAVMAGADVVQIVSALLRSGPARLGDIRDEFVRWAMDRGYASIGDMRGRVSLARATNPAAFERGNYVRMLQAWHGGES